MVKIIIASSSIPRSLTGEYKRGRECEREEWGEERREERGEVRREERRRKKRRGEKRRGV